MNKLKILLGLTAACAACCAAPLALPFIVAILGGVGLAGIGTLLADGWVAIAGVALAILAAIVLFRRRAAAQC